MGQTQISCKELLEPILDINECKPGNSPKDESSYNGLRSESETNNYMNATNESTPTTLSIEESTESEIVCETEIIWRDGGAEVFVAGSFSDWKQWFALKKEGDYHILKIFLPKGKHFIKFIVDRCWVCSSYYETALDGDGNLNNIIYNECKELKEEQLTPKDKHSSKNHDKERKIRTISENSQTSYSDNKPEREYLNTHTLLLPDPYMQPFNFSALNSQHERLKSKNLQDHSLTLADNLLYLNCNVTMPSISISSHANL